MASKTGVVQVSGRGANVDFIIDDTSPFEEVSQGLRLYLIENRKLWSSGTINVDAGRWARSADQLGKLKHVIETESGLTVGRFWCSPNKLSDTDFQKPSEYGSESFNPTQSNHPVMVHNAPAAIGKSTSEKLAPELVDLLTRHEPEPGVEQGKSKQTQVSNSRKGMPTEALFVKQTFRSGESISYAGDVVVMADVNPGAEISAEGDIVVFGKLKGMAHAGSAGDVKATIIALELDSPRIQIGPYAGLAPTMKLSGKSGSKSKGAGPKIAYVRRRSIYVSSYAGRFARYSRGILYDG